LSHHRHLRLADPARLEFGAEREDRTVLMIRRTEIVETKDAAPGQMYLGLQLRQFPGMPRKTDLGNYRTGLGMSETENIAKSRRCIYKRPSLLEPGRICMIMSYSQIASSRPKPMMDAHVAR
jgi:hypothetical protein